MEPENRLVARTLERDWEKALTEQARLAAEHERARRARKEAPAATELAAICDLSQDLPALWRADTTTQAERQTIVRLLIERVLVEVVDATEKVRVECHWHGGVHTRHELTRPVARVASLSTYAALTGRAAELRREGLECARIAEILNAEGWRPAKRRDTFNAQMVHHLLLISGAETIKYRRRPSQIERLENEWTIRELADEIGMPQPTLYTWVQKGRLSCRNVGSGSKRAVLVRADPGTIAALKAIRATPPPWRRLPPRPAEHAATPATEVLRVAMPGRYRPGADRDSATLPATGSPSHWCAGVNGAAIFLKSGAAKFPSLAGWRSAVGVIGASVLWRPAATPQGRRNGIGGGVRLEADRLGQEVGVLAQPIAGALDLDDDGVMKKPVEECGGDDGITGHL